MDHSIRHILHTVHCSPSESTAPKIPALHQKRSTRRQGGHSLRWETGATGWCGLKSVDLGRLPVEHPTELFEVTAMYSQSVVQGLHGSSPLNDRDCGQTVRCLNIGVQILL
jgi:hypothetical protein